jgi:hypothetical protein
MGDLLIILAFICFALACVWFAVSDRFRSYPMALVCAGLALWVLSAYGPITIG